MKILMVCLGNICRSPLTEGILKAKLSDDFFVDSVGTISLHEGEHPDERATETAARHGIDISKQVSRPITDHDLNDFDKIYCMDLKIYEDVVSKAKNERQRNKISLFLEAAGNQGNAQVPDPFWSEMNEFEEVFQLLDHACNKIARRLTQHLTEN